MSVSVDLRDAQVSDSVNEGTSSRAAVSVCVKQTKMSDRFLRRSKHNSIFVITISALKV